MMMAKKWIKIFFIIFFLIIGIIGGTNYIVDPLWSFSHKNQLNEIQLPFNERQQKSNYVYFNKLDKYDSVLFGSSRTSYISQNDFANMKVYNYSLNGMWPYEYDEYLKLAKESKGNDFKYIIIGADFYNSMEVINKLFEEPIYYTTKTKSFFYRYKMLFSFDLFKRSIRNIKINIYKKPPKYYTRDNIKINQKVSEKERVQRYNEHIIKHTKGFIGKNYTANNEYIKILRKLKQENTNTKFIIFTSAISADLLVSIIKNGHRINEYEKWLKEMIEVFGEVHHFMTINSITTNLQNYPDDDHCYPDVGELIANKITRRKNGKIPKDFGIILNKNNIDDFMIKFKKQLKKYKNPIEL